MVSLQFIFVVLSVALADKEREGRWSGDYFFSLCVKYIFLALSKRWIRRE